MKIKILHNKIVAVVPEGVTASGVREATQEEVDLLEAAKAAKKMVRVVNGVWEEVDPPVRVRELSKLTIRRRLRDLGKEDEFDAFLDSNTVARRDWDDAQLILSNDPMFTTYAPQVKAALELTDEEFDSIIA